MANKAPHAFFVCKAPGTCRALSILTKRYFVVALKSQPGTGLLDSVLWKSPVTASAAESCGSLECDSKPTSLQATIYPAGEQCCPRLQFLI